jgi:hypothetical protein
MFEKKIIHQKMKADINCIFKKKLCLRLFVNMQDRYVNFMQRNIFDDFLFSFQTKLTSPMDGCFRLTYTHDELAFLWIFFSHFSDNNFYYINHEAIQSKYLCT